MTTTYKGYAIRTNNNGSGEVTHSVTYRTISHTFETITEAMNFIDGLESKEA